MSSYVLTPPTDRNRIECGEFDHQLYFSYAHSTEKDDCSQVLGVAGWICIQCGNDLCHDCVSSGISKARCISNVYHTQRNYTDLCKF
jgi:hypothetical protein